jgi:hypothetical protein
MTAQWIEPEVNGDHAGESFKFLLPVSLFSSHLSYLVLRLSCNISEFQATVRTDTLSSLSSLLLLLRSWLLPQFQWTPTG